MKPKHFIICLACLLLLAAPAAAAGGDGTSANPYQIETAPELQSIQNDLSAHYILMNDIDLTGVTWTPIGSTSAGFFGELDGNGHTISNLNLSATTQSAGLFSSLTSGATIKDLTLADCHVESTASWCGTLAGSIIMSESEHEVATLLNVELVRCSASSTSYSVSNIIGFISTAAVVNIIDCTISQCLSKSTSYDVSNIVGSCSNVYSLIIDNANVVSCIAESITNSASVVGRCYATSSINVKETTVSNCIIKSDNCAGGFCGSTWNSGSSISVSNCNLYYCTVVSNFYSGGINGRIANSATGVFTNNIVSDCSILATVYAAGVCPAYS